MVRRNVTVFLTILCFLASNFRAKAADMQEGLPPHLIQTVSEQDVYESLIALGMLRCSILTEADCGAAYENVKDCVVRINMGNAYGSGIIWDMAPDAVMIATNAHVLDYWNDNDCYILFSQGNTAGAEMLGCAQEYDVGFLRVDNDDFSYRQLESLRCAYIDEEAYSALEEGDVMFAVGSGADAGQMEFHEGTVGDKWKYIDTFDSEMLYGYGFAKEGMSGGGVFDGRGRLIGMLSGGTGINETASVPLPAVIEAYERRDDGAGG